jgi:hypothetical protein
MTFPAASARTYLRGYTSTRWISALGVRSSSRTSSQRHSATKQLISIEKAERQLDYSPKFSNKEALIRNFRWYLDNLSKFENASGVSHRVPWKQGAVGMLKWFF